MAKSSIDIVISQIVNNLNTKGNECTDQLNKILDDIDKSMNKLATYCYEFNVNYDNYTYKNVKDASLLKEKLKEAVIKVSNDEIS